jgi:hypothetical protein
MGEKFINMLTSDIPSIEEIELKEKREINDLINLLVPLYLKDLSKKLTTNFTKYKIINLHVGVKEGEKINEKIAEKIVIEMQKMVKSKGWKLEYVSRSPYAQRISISLSRFSNLDKFIASILDFSWLLPKKTLIE